MAIWIGKLFDIDLYGLKIFKSYFTALFFPTNFAFPKTTISNSKTTISGKNHIKLGTVQ